MRCRLTWDTEMAKRAGRAVGVCMCEREDGEGLQRRTKRRSSLAGRVGTRPGTKEAWLAFSLLSLKLRCVKTTRCGLFQAIPHSILFRPCILSGLRHSICLPIQCILYFWPFNCTLTASRPLPTQARPEKNHKRTPDPDFYCYFCVGPISVSGPNRLSSTRTILHLMLMDNSMQTLQGAFLC